MSEPFVENLSRFTPDSGGLNRDEIIFAAGRRSVRPNRGWITLASALAATQALSLVILWPSGRPLPPGLTVVHGTAPAAAPALENASSALDHPGVWSAHLNLAELEPEERPAGDISLIESGPPLRAFAPSRVSLLD
jgi:hypothetical protein